VVAAHVTNLAGLSMPLPIAMLLGIVVAMLAAAVPGIINGLLTGSYEQASYAIQDTPDMIQQHYGRFLPQDKAALAAKILTRFGKRLSVSQSSQRRSAMEAPSVRTWRPSRPS
jgi:hypothetical protein